MAQGKAVSWRATSAAVAFGVFVLVLFVGVNLRTSILAVPPLLAIISTDLNLNHSQTGLLTSLPSLMMGLGAWPAGRVAARIGGRMSVVLGLALATLGTVARGLWPTTIGLYVLTAALAAGIAVAQTAIPTLARQWFPERIGLVSAVFTDGLTLGETLAAALTAPLMRAWFGPNAWPAALLIWAIPMTVALLLWLWLANGGEQGFVSEGENELGSDTLDLLFQVGLAGLHVAIGGVLVKGPALDCLRVKDA